MIINFVKNHPDAKLPTFADIGCTGADLYTIENKMLLGTINEAQVRPPSLAVLETGLSIANITFHPYNENPDQERGLDIQIRMRSGMASKGLVLLNGIGTIDHTYRGPIKVLVANLGYAPIFIEKGDRIAQLVIGVCYPADEVGFRFVDSDMVEPTQRGNGGFGSTGR